MIGNLLIGKKVLVTGASSGIGKAIAVFFSQQGAQVILSGRNKERLDDTLKLLTGEGHIIFSSDISKIDDLKELMDFSFNSFGALDSVVHCAGIQKTLPLQAVKEQQFDDIFNINVKSAQFIAKFLRRKGCYNVNGCSLIYISSVAAFCGEPAISTYCASKAALIGLSKSLAVELAKLNIRVNTISPGHVETEMAISFKSQLSEVQVKNIQDKHPLGLGRPEDIAHAAAYLASDLSRWVTGSNLIVDGGYSTH